MINQGKLTHPGIFSDTADALEFLTQVLHSREVSREDYNRAICCIENRLMEVAEKEKQLNEAIERNKRQEEEAILFT